MRFKADHITDQKRFVRGEHLLAARTLLRARDEVHNKAWRVLIVAGPAPHEEIGALRELMPKCHVTAVDIDPVCVEAAKAAGADDAFVADLRDPGRFWFYDHKDERFDLMNLDLCSPAHDDTRRIFSLSQKFLASSGVLMASFSYGRDVVEAQIGRVGRWQNGFGTNRREAIARLVRHNIPNTIIPRLCSALTPGMLLHCASIMVYRGKETPMCATLTPKTWMGGVPRHGQNDPGLSFVRVENTDIEYASVYPDTAPLYATPRERIEAWRRRFAALKAVHTRTIKRQAEQAGAA